MADSYGPLLLTEYSCLEKVVTNSQASSSQTQQKWVYAMLFICYVFDVCILYIYFLYIQFMCNLEIIKCIYKICIRYVL